MRGAPTDEAQFALDFLILVTAAGDTMRNVIASGVEEMLRWVAPVCNMRRTAMADTEVAGYKILAGQKLAMYYGIANRDPAQFSDP